MRLLMVGLDAAGKTTILYKLKWNEIVKTNPTISFNAETVEYNNIKFTVWDIGGNAKTRCLYRHYYQDANGIIFVIDSNDRQRIEEAAEELNYFIVPELKDAAIILVLANKQDLPHAMSVNEITDKLNLNSIKSRKWFIQGTCATIGSGLYERLDWISKNLSRHKN